MREVRIRWNAKQSMAIKAVAIEHTHRYVKVFGGIRSGKSWAGCGATGILVTNYPGIHCFLTRWTQDALDGQLKPEWRAHAERIGLQYTWNASEEYDGLPNGSRVYLRGLKSSDDTKRYARTRGLTLAFIFASQAEEIPVDYAKELQGRLSQPGYPQHMLLDAQPTGPDHWLEEEFPAHNEKPNYLSIHTNVYDNRENIGDEYIAALEAAYPVGSAQHRTLLMGYPGLASHGQPVYAGYFQRETHVIKGNVAIDPYCPVIEAWDWGHGHPCVSWWQFNALGAMVGLGSVMGTNMFLEDFAPAVLGIRSTWIGQVAQLWSCGDPAGLDVTNQGTRTSKVRDILASHGIVPTSTKSSNTPETRSEAIQTIGGYMRRLALDGQPAFRMHPRALVLSSAGAKSASFTVDGFEAGYEWDDRARYSQTRTLRLPKKDGYYDHFQNTAEYAVINYGPAAPSLIQQTQALKRYAVNGPKDHDPADRGYAGIGSRRVSRGGY